MLSIPAASGFVKPSLPGGFSFALRTRLFAFVPLDLLIYGTAYKTVQALSTLLCVGLQLGFPTFWES